MKIDVINKSINDLPTYAKLGDAGMDIRADFSNGIKEDFMFGAAYDEMRETILVFSGGRCLVPTGIYTSFPAGYEVQIRPRSGLALKQGITVLNSPGTIDAGYRNEWGIIIQNLGDEVFEIKQGDRIAQAVLTKVEIVDWNVVETLDDSHRGQSGYGDSGIK